MASSDLPEDVVIHILSWLPVISLMRFKCVCKPWCALIESSTFIAQHLNHATFNNNNGNGSLLCRRTKDKYAFFLLSDETFEVSVNLDVPYFNEDPGKVKLDMLASCNGIICLSDLRSKNLALWNPAIREFKALPESRVPLPPGTKFRSGSVGFGFDVKTNDYKVVRVVYLLYYDGQWANHQVEVYSLSTDSWRLIEAVMPTHSLRPPYPRSWTYVNGIYSWFGLPEEMLISFDMSDELFRRTPLPDICSDSVYAEHSRSFAVLNESIALILFHLGYVEKCFEIWVLNEYGVKESWTKLYTIGPVGPIFGFGWPLGFSKNGELFVGLFETVIKDEQLILCDPVTREIKNLRTDGNRGSLQVLVYNESLVSIKGGNDPAKMRTR